MTGRESTDSCVNAVPKATPNFSSRRAGADVQAPDSARTLVYEPVFSPGQQEVESAIRYGSNTHTPSQTPKPLGFTTSASPSSGVTDHEIAVPGAPRQSSHDAAQNFASSPTFNAVPSQGIANSIQAGQCKLSTPPATKLPF